MSLELKFYAAVSASVCLCQLLLLFLSPPPLSLLSTLLTPSPFLRMQGQHIFDPDAVRAYREAVIKGHKAAATVAVDGNADSTAATTASIQSASLKAEAV